MSYFNNQQVCDLAHKDYVGREDTYSQKPFYTPQGTLQENRHDSFYNLSPPTNFPMSTSEAHQPNPFAPETDPMGRAPIPPMGPVYRQEYCLSSAISNLSLSPLNCTRLAPITDLPPFSGEHPQQYLQAEGQPNIDFSSRRPMMTHATHVSEEYRGAEQAMGHRLAPMTPGTWAAPGSVPTGPPQLGAGPTGSLAVAPARSASSRRVVATGRVQKPTRVKPIRNYNFKDAEERNSEEYKVKRTKNLKAVRISRSKKGNRHVEVYSRTHLLELDNTALRAKYNEQGEPRPTDYGLRSDFGIVPFVADKKERAMLGLLELPQ